MVKVTMSWLLMPGTTLPSAVRVGVDDRTRSDILILRTHNVLAE